MLRVQNEQSQKDLTFQPKVNEKSKKIVEVKNNEMNNTYYSGSMAALPVQERLYRDATDRLERNFFNTMVENDPQKPHISQQSKWISENSQMFNGHMKDFYERQNAFLQK